MIARRDCSPCSPRAAPRQRSWRISAPMRALSFQDLRGGRCAGPGEVRPAAIPPLPPDGDLGTCPPFRRPFHTKISRAALHRDRRHPLGACFGGRSAVGGLDLPVDHEVGGDESGMMCRQPNDRRGRGGRAGVGERGASGVRFRGGRGHPCGGIAGGVGALYLVNDRSSAPAPRERGRRRPGMIPGRRSLDMSPARPVRPARHPRRARAARADAGSPEHFPERLTVPTHPTPGCASTPERSPP